MVLGYVLGQLKTEVVVIGRHPPDHTGHLEVDQVTVGRAAREAGSSLCDVLDAYRMAGVGQQLDHLPPPAGVALRDLPEPLLDQAMQRFVHNATLPLLGLRGFRPAPGDRQPPRPHTKRRPGCRRRSRWASSTRTTPRSRPTPSPGQGRRTGPWPPQGGRSGNGRRPAARS